MGNDPNYISGLKLVDFLNTFGFGVDYRYPLIDIETKDIGESFSMLQKYTFEKLKKLYLMGKIPNVIEHFLQSVNEPLEAHSRLKEV